MAYRQIHTQIWRDEWFQELSTEAKLLWIYLFSSDSSNILGLYKLNLRVVEFDTSLSRSTIEEIIKKFENDGKVVYQDGYIWIINLLRYNFNKSDKTVIHIKNELSKIPYNLIKIAYIAHANTVLIPYGYSIDGVSSGTVAVTVTESVAEAETETNSDNHRPTSTTAAISAFQDIDARRCEQICQKVTGQPTIPPDQYSTTIELLKFIIPNYDNEQKLIDAGKGHFTRWCNTRGKNGRYYSRTNYGWISWWYESIAPDPDQSKHEKIDAPLALCGTGQVLKRKAEDLGDRDHEQAVIEFRKHIDTCRICGGKTVESNPMPEEVKAKLRNLTRGKVISDAT